MAPISDVDWQQLGTVQGPTTLRALTIASANVIAPSTFLTILTGNVVVKTITPPVLNGHMLAIQFAGVAGVDNTGNVLTTTASIAGQIMLLVYNPNTGKYIPVG